MDNIGTTSTPSSLSGFSPATEAATSACEHCNAPHGHFGYCPLLNRNVAEARSAGFSLADATHPRGFGVIA